MLLYTSAISISMERDKNLHTITDANPKLKQCFDLGQIAMELDAMYHTTKQLVAVSSVEDAYLKALKCFVESYEKNQEDALVQISKMSYLLVSIECERQKNDPSYRMPSEISDIYKKGRSIRKCHEKLKTIDQLKPRDKQPERTNSNTDNEFFKKLTVLHEAMNQLNYSTPRIPHAEDDEIYAYLKYEIPQRPRAGSLIDASHLALQQGEQLCLKAYKMLPANLIDKDDVYLSMQETYAQAMQLFIDAYKHRSYQAFGHIQSTFEHILNTEKIRQAIKGPNYKVSQQCIELYDQLTLIKAQEKERIQKEKNLYKTPTLKTQTILPRHEQKNKTK